MVVQRKIDDFVATLIERTAERHLPQALEKRPRLGHGAIYALADMAAVRELRAMLDELELDRAREAKAHGATWADLAEAAGLARASSAQGRYGHADVNERRTKYAAENEARRVRKVVERGARSRTQ